MPPVSAPLPVHTGNRYTSTVGSCPRNDRRSSLLSARTQRANLPTVTSVERTRILLVPGRIRKNQHLCARVCHGMMVIPLPSPSETSYLGHHKVSGLTSAALKHSIDCISHPIHKHRLFRSLPPYKHSVQSQIGIIISPLFNNDPRIRDGLFSSFLLFFRNFPFSPSSPRLVWLAQGPARLKPALSRPFESEQTDSSPPVVRAQLLITVCCSSRTGRTTGIPF